MSRQSEGFFVHGDPVTEHPVHGGLIPTHGGTNPISGSDNRNPYASYALALNFAENADYWDGETLTDDVTSLSGYSYTRSGAKAELAASTGLASFAANVPGIVPGVGYWARGAVTNKCANYNANPTDLTNISAFGATVTVVDDAAALAAAGLSGICTSGKVYKVVATAADQGFNVANTAVLNLVAHSMSAYIRCESGSALLSWDNNSGASDPVSSSSYARVSSLNTVAPLAASRMRVKSTGGAATFYVVLNRLVEGTQAGPVIVTAGAAATVGVDDLNVGVSTESGDQYILAVAEIKTPVAAIEMLAEFSDGTTNNRIILRRIGDGSLAFLVVIGGVVVVNIAGPVMASAGRLRMMAVRRSGQWALAYKIGSGAAAITAFTTAGMPALTTVDVGNNLSNSVPLNAPVEFLGIREGTFTDAECLEILENA